jgi:anti-sigma-K factor RskA
MTRNVSARSPEKRARWSGLSRRSIVGAAMALLATTAIGACASGHAHRGSGDQQIVVHLTNDLAPPSDVTVFAVSQDGVRRLLGDVPPNKDRVLKVPTDIFPGTVFRIVAERTGGRPIVSQPITATSGGQMIDWDLQTNAIWFPETAS